MIAPAVALTVWPEWAWMICLGATAEWPAHLDPKRVENRGWHPGRRLPIGARLAIHAGKSLGGRPTRAAADDAVASVLSMYRRANPYELLPFAHFRERLRTCPTSAIVATVTIAGYDRDERTGWDVPDAWHWRLFDVVPLREPVPCAGAQGLWALRGDVRERLSEQGGGVAA